MSRYLEFSIERKDEKDNWKCIVEDTSDEHLAIINNYILRDLFIEYGKWSYYLDKHCTKETINEFAHKIEHSKYNEKNLSKDYPYQYTPFYKNLSTDIIGLSSKFDGFIDMLNREITNNIDFKYSDIIVEIPINIVIKHINQLVNFLETISDNFDIEKFFKIKESIKNGANLLDFKDSIKLNAKNNLELYFETPYSLVQFLQYDSRCKNNEKEFIDIFSNSVVKSISYYQTLDEDFNVLIDQWNIDKVLVSTINDLLAMKNDLELRIKGFENSMKAENLAKSYIQDIISEFQNDTSKLKQRLVEFIGDNEGFDNIEWLEDLKSQLSELNLVIKLVGDFGRFIWRIE